MPQFLRTRNKSLDFFTDLKDLHEVAETLLG